MLHSNRFEIMIMHAQLRLCWTVPRVSSRVSTAATIDDSVLLFCDITVTFVVSSFLWQWWTEERFDFCDELSEVMKCWNCCAFSSRSTTNWTVAGSISGFLHSISMSCSCAHGLTWQRVGSWVADLIRSIMPSCHAPSYPIPIPPPFPIPKCSHASVLII